MADARKRRTTARGNFDEKTQDSSIIATADDAIFAKLSACETGYYDDPFLAHFASGRTRPLSITSPPPSSGRSSLSSSRPQRVQLQPLIRRGTHARVCCIDRAVASFLGMETGAGNRKQIVVLGSGKDTSYLRLLTHKLLFPTDGLVAPPYNDENSEKVTHQKPAEMTPQEGHPHENDDQVGLRWYEVDHSSVIRRKHELLITCPNTVSLVSTPKKPMSTSDSEDKDYMLRPHPSESFAQVPCHLVGFDLRSDASEMFQHLTDQHSFCTETPTLFLLECVQMYLTESSSRQLLTEVVRTCSNAVIAIYDPILRNDPFGRVMEQNLTKAGILDANAPASSDTALALTQTRTLLDQLEKLLDCGFETAVGCDMIAAYATVLTPHQRATANSCEMLDEMEEWTLVMQHYCFLIAGARSRDNITTPGSTWTEAFCAVGPDSPMGFQSDHCTVRRREG